MSHACNNSHCILSMGHEHIKSCISIFRKPFEHPTYHHNQHPENLSFKYTNCLLTFLMLSVSIRFMECFVRFSILLMFLFHAFTIIMWFITRLEAAAQACIICTVSYLWDCVQCNVVTKWKGREWAYGCCCCWFNHVLCILSSQGKRKVPSLTI